MFDSFFVVESVYSFKFVFFFCVFKLGFYCLIFQIVFRGGINIFIKQLKSFC